MVTTFLKQVLAGTIQELQVYKHRPFKLLAYFSTVIISGILQVIIYKISNTISYKNFNPSSLDDLMKMQRVWSICTTLQLFLSVFYFAPALLMIYDMAQKRESTIQSIITVNGMKRSAYIAKLLVPNYLLMLIVAAEKSIEYLYVPLTIKISPYTVFKYYFALMMATVNLCLLLSRCIKAKQAVTISFILFAVLPYYTYLLIRSNVAVPYLPLAFMNPTALVNHVIPPNFELVLRINLFLAALVGFVFLGLYLLIEKIAEIRTREKKTIEAQNSVELASKVLLPSDDLEENLLTQNLNKFEQEMLNSNQKLATGVKDVKKIYKGSDLPALNNVSLKIFEEETFCMAGLNGAGKTTLVQILSGFIKPTEGVRYCTFYNTSSKSTSMGFCSQDSLALSDNTVYENLMFWTRIKNVPRDKIQSEVNKAMERLGLKASRNTIISKLSIENRKKLCIAIALLNDPKVVVMDEPTSGLDAASRKIFREIIGEMKRDKKTVIFTTQFLDDAEHFVDRLAIYLKER